LNALETSAPSVATARLSRTSFKATAERTKLTTTGESFTKRFNQRQQKKQRHIDPRHDINFCYHFIPCRPHSITPKFGVAVKQLNDLVVELHLPPQTHAPARNRKKAAMAARL